MSEKYLEFNEFVPYASREVDKEVKVNHCKSGESNKALFIRRTKDGILAYCHHCGKRGYYRDASPSHISTVRRTYRNSKGSATNTKSISSASRRVTLPADSVQWTERPKWTAASRFWLSRYSLKPSEIIQNGVSYSPSKGRIYFPVYHNTELVGFQARRIEAEGPKWLSIYSDKSKFYVYYRRHTDTCVVVEDIVSGMRCARHLSTYVLLGAHISDTGLNQIKHHKEFLIFLDDDNTQVRMNQLKLKKQLELFGKVRIIHRGTDPKNLSEVDLCRELTGTTL